MSSADAELIVTRGTPVPWLGPTVPDTYRTAREFEPDPGLRIEAIVDHTHGRGHFPWSARWWREGEFLVRLQADLDEPTWGLVMCELLAHLADDDDVTAPAVLARALEKHRSGIERWALYPGVQFVGSDGSRVTPGCCAALNNWWDLRSPEEYLLGHDPHVTAALDGDRVLIRSAMAASEESDRLMDEPMYLCTTRARWHVALDELHAEMEAVAARLERWALSLGCDATLAANLAATFRDEFVGRSHRS